MFDILYSECRTIKNYHFSHSSVHHINIIATRIVLFMLKFLFHY